MTHPFHPWHGREYELVTYRLNWGEHRVYFFDEQGDLAALPAAWTSVGLRDPFVEVSGGRSAFRFVDLLELSRFVQVLAPGDTP
ncbi:MAG TPA: DUF5372 family protein [Vicinamibacterales bacterium]|nr:DUF5372 family protein [Vicinamibacterales bacterium]